MQLTNANKLAFNESREGRSLLLDTLHWNVCALPLRNACIDVVTTDLVSETNLFLCVHHGACVLS